jgi:hypothetical protein
VRRAQAQRDLSISYNNLGDLVRQLGDGAQAERYYRDVAGGGVGIAVERSACAGDPRQAAIARRWRRPVGLLKRPGMPFLPV